MSQLRINVKTQDKWDLESVYPNNKAWDKHFAQIENALVDIQTYKGTLNSKDTVLACLKAFFELESDIEKLYVFAYCRANEDHANNENSIIMGRMESLLAAGSAKLAFIEVELAQGKSGFLNTLAADTQFIDYSFFIQQVIREKEHLLSLGEEELLANLREVLGASRKIFNKLTNTDMVFQSIIREGKKEELTSTTFQVFLEDQNRDVRRQAMENRHTVYRQFRGSLCESLAAHVKKNVVLARIRKYSSAIDLFLHGKDIPDSVYKTLFQVTNDHLHLLHRYCAIRKKVMILDELHWYDLYVPLVGEISNKFSYAKAVKIICQAVAPLGAEYVTMLSNGLTNEKWVDKYENQGKRSGAYSLKSYHSKPFILMNYSGILDSVFTLGHEGGHSMHGWYAKNAQPFPKYNYVIFIAEIASTLNEQLISQHLLDGADKKMRAFIINKQLESIRGTFFRQVMFAEFEAMLYQTVWDGKVLTPDFMEEEYYKLNTRYYGNDVVIDDVLCAEWSRIPHFYYNFYVYQYATGIASASYFANEIVAGGEAERENYLDLLRAGGSEYPVTILKNSGLDVTKSDYLQSLMNTFENLLNEFEEIIT